MVVAAAGGRKYPHFASACALLAAFGIAGCAAQQAVPAPTPIVASPSHVTVVGVASWYGPGFKGHSTSSGEIYTANEMTAASTMFPLGTRLRVTDLDNQRAVEVIVNDHGPYVKGRKLDLSERAARALGMMGPGTARVRMEVLSTPDGGPPLGARYFVQIGSFADLDNARRARARIAAYYPDAQIETADAPDGLHYRVRMGAFLDRQAAIERAQAATERGFPAMLITQ